MLEYLFADIINLFVNLRIFFTTRLGFENWGISLGYSPVLAGNIQSQDAFKPIASEGKYLMDYI